MSLEYWLQLASSEYWLQFAQQHWAQIALFFLTVIPSVYLLHRTGIHIALAAFNLIPIGGTVVLLWVIAFSKWPSRQLSASVIADGRKVKEPMGGKPMSENTKPTPLPDEMITRVADRFGANAWPEERATLEAKKKPLSFMQPEPPLRRFN